MEKASGTLYIVPTPIGNLEDITLRALRILKEVDMIAAEDTRNTLKLLRHFEIKNPLYSYHEHNEQKKSSELIISLKKGKSVALVSDAGMPGISDPGHVFIKKAIEEGIPMEVLPGASALINALVGSGLSTEGFSFYGFFPRNKKERRKQMEALKKEEKTMIFYESPRRIKATLGELQRVLGNPKAVVARELTKVFEEFIRGTLKELEQVLDEAPVKGEIVLLIEGCPKEQPPSFEGLSIEEHLLMVMSTGLTKKEAMKAVAKERGIPKREVYEVTIKEE